MQQSQLGKPLYVLLIAGLLSACGGGSSNDDTPTLSAPSTNNGSSIVPTTQPKPLITPAAPSNPQVDDSSNTFGWTALASYPLASDYEYSVDNGVNWTVAGDNPVSIGDVALAAGAVQVRVKAQAGKHNAGNILKSDTAFTSTLPTPAAPTGSQVDDANDTFDWTNVTGYVDVRDYEYRIGNAKSWLEVDKKPLSVGNQNIAKDALQLRVKAKPKQNTAGKVLSNHKAFTSILPTPAAATAPVVDDTKNTFDWTYVSGYTNPNQYEYKKAGDKNWTEVPKKPLEVGNIALAVGDLELRVKEQANVNQAGKVLKNNKAFTKKTSASGGWVSYNGSEYKILSAGSSQDNAKTACTAAGGSLADADSLKPYNTLATTLKFDSSQQYWVEQYDKYIRFLYDAGSSYGGWKVKSYGFPSSARPICKKQSSSGGGSTGGTETWQNYNGKQYLVVYEKKKLSEAKPYCQGKGAHVIKVSNGEDLSALATALKLKAEDYNLDNGRLLKSTWTVNIYYPTTYKKSFICEK